MLSLDSFNVISGLVTIFTFVFAFWVWVKSDVKIKEYTRILQAIHNISGSAIWESKTIGIDSKEIQLRQSEKTMGFVSSIRELTEPYAEGCLVV